MEKKIFIFFFLISLSCLLFAQKFSTNELSKSRDDKEKYDFFQKYKSMIDPVFSEIPSYKIKTGILIERSIAYANLRNFDGKENCDTANADLWLNVYKQVYSGCLNLDNFNYDQALSQKYPIINLTNGEIPIGIIFYDYNRISINPQMAGKIIVDTINHKIKDISKGNENPFEIATCFMVAPMANNLPLGDYNFYLSPELLKSNKIISSCAIYVDFNDGNGYDKIEIGSGKIVNFNTTGIKLIRYKFAIGDKVYFGKSTINIINPLKENRNSKSTIKYNLADFGPTNFIDNGIKAEYGIYFRCNGDNTIRKPYIIVSGFDPTDKNRVQDDSIRTSVFSSSMPSGNFIYAGVTYKGGTLTSYYDNDLNTLVYTRGEYSYYLDSQSNLWIVRIYVLNKEKVNLYHVANKNGYLDELRENGYDIIIYRSTQSTSSIITNANNLVNFIIKINAEKTSDNQLIIAGASEGGLIVRYALTYMEHTGVDHQTKLFLSIDSPQNGASVPLGFQEFVVNMDDVINDYVNFSDMLGDAVDILNSVASQQMCIYHNSNVIGAKAGCSIERSNYLKSLNAIDNFPRNCRTVGISLGSGTGVNQGFSAGQVVLKKNKSQILSNLINPLIAPGTELTWEFTIRSVPDRVSCEIYYSKVDMQTCIWIANPSPNPIEVFKHPFIKVCTTAPLFPKVKSVTVDNTYAYDNAPGSTQDLHNTGAFNFTGLTFLTAIDALEYDTHPDCFIPAISSLALNSVTDPLTNIKSYLNNQASVIKVNDNQYINNGGNSISNFDVLYIENTNLDHIYDDDHNGVFSEGMTDAMSQESESNNLFIENKSIESTQSIAFEARNTIVVGTNVDGYLYNNGNVDVESGGALTLSANDYIKLEPGFHANSGSTVKIKPVAAGYCASGTIVTLKSSDLSDENNEIEPSTYQGNNGVEEEKTELLDLIEEYSKPIILYPNPTKSKVFISSNKQLNRVTIYSVDGQILLDEKFNKSTELDLTNYHAGLYLVKIIQEDGTEIVERITKN